MAAAAILGVIGGDPIVAVVFGLTAVINIGHLALNPAMRPERVARSLEGSRRLIALES
jgi:hypothetical protein